ncbi:MAG TPA: YicC/YloC family endoribonuclease, partial [Pirellulales bacterium]|nr:YicC/YloC family endoribonuclease [Pirellulales bacterium]
MLLSMTGCGEAHRQADGVAVAVEVRAINNRYFKLAFKCGEGYTLLEGEVENLVRQHIRRGTVQVTLRVDRPRSPDSFRIDPSVLANYRRQLGELDTDAKVPLESLLMLPGVVIENPTDAGVAEKDWPLIRTTLTAAMEALDEMRRGEGRAMAGDLAVNCRAIAGELAGVEVRAPLV